MGHDIVQVGGNILASNHVVTMELVCTVGGVSKLCTVCIMPYKFTKNA